MSIKSKGRRIGRMIRRITGLPFPTCMGIGKSIVQRKNEYDIQEKYPDVYVITSRKCGDGCCSYSQYKIVGPRGSIIAEYGLGERDITEEYNLIRDSYIRPSTPRKVRESVPSTVRDPQPPEMEEPVPSTVRGLPPALTITEPEVDSLPVEVMRRWVAVL